MKYCALALLLLVGCVQDSRTTVTTQNSLGVVSLAFAESTERGERVVELAGFDAADQRIALVRVRVGTVPQLDQLGPRGDVGSEVVISVTGGQATTSISRETSSITIAGFDAPTRTFLELPEVSELLRGARFVVLAEGAAGSEVAYADYTQTCPASTLLVSPVAYQCCYSGSGGSAAGSGDGYYGYYPATFHVRTEDHTNLGSALIYRKQSTCGGCKSQSCGSCSGNACYYGPFGFARPVLTQRPANAYSRTINVTFGNDTWCDGALFTSNPPAPYWPQASGTNATGQGCPGGASGAGEWDYF